MRWGQLEPRPFVLGGPLTPAVRTLLGVNIAVFLFQAVAGILAHVRFDRIFGLVPYDVVHHLFLWQLGTYMFLHGGLLHIALNMLALWMFGGELEALWGTKRFVRFYFVTGIGAGIMTTLVAPNSYVPTIGASGAIYGLLAAYGILFPDRILLLYFVLPVKAKYLVLVLGLLTFWSSLTATGGGVAHVAHLGGMIFGWLYLRGLKPPGGSLRRALEVWREKRLRSKFRVYYRKTRGEDERPDKE